MGIPVGSTIDLMQIATPASSPAAGKQLLYVKSDGKVYTKTSAGVESLVGPDSTAGLGAVDLTTAQSVGGQKTFTSSPIITNSLNIQGATVNSIEIGRVDGTASTPFIDMHSGATASDYDSRIIASGGTGVNGAGTLNLTAATVIAGGQLQEASNRVYSAGNKVPLSSLIATGSPTASNFLRGDGSWAVGNIATQDETVSLSTNTETIDFQGDGVSAALFSGSRVVVSVPGVTNTRALLTANVNLNSLTNVIDGVTLVNGDKVLVVGQTTSAQNGIYTATGVSGGLMQLVRSVGYDTSVLISKCGPCEVQSGTTYGGTCWLTNFKGTDILGTTNMPWTVVWAPSLPIAGAILLAPSSTFNQPQYLTPSTQGYFVGSASTPNFTNIPNNQQALLSPFKDWCRVATTGPITLSGTQTIDGIGVVSGDRVLVKNQASALTNGIYVVSGGAWSRALDADTAIELGGAIVSISAGTANGSMLYRTTFKGSNVLGTDAVDWWQLVDVLSGDLRYAPLNTNPPGSMMMWMTATAPTGWIFANGQSTASFPNLATIFGATVPDMRGLFPMGAAAVANGLGNIAGGQANMPQHQHVMSNHTHGTSALSATTTGSSHNHPYDVSATAGTSNATIMRGTATVASSGIAAAFNPNMQTHTHSISGSTDGPTAANTGNAGTGTTPDDNRPPFLQVNFIIKT